MDSVLQESPAKLLSRRGVCLFCVIWLATQLAFLNACEYEPASSEKCNKSTMTVLEGLSLEVPLGTLEHVTDLCIWNSSVSSWDSACQFVGGTCQTLLTYFNKSISVLGKTFVMRNMNKEDSGRYRILDLSRNCLEINVSILDSSSNVPLIVCCTVGVIIIIFIVLWICIKYKLIEKCQQNTSSNSNTTEDYIDLPIQGSVAFPSDVIQNPET